MSAHADKVDDILGHLDPDMIREEWVKVAMGLKAQFSEAEGWDLFNGWSSRGKRYCESDARDTWRSINAAGGVTFGTVVSMAQNAGWTADNSPKKATKQKPKAPTLAEWNQAAPATADHPYLKRKGAAGAAELLHAREDDGSFPRDNASDNSLLRVREDDGALLVPMMSRDGSVQSVQAISADGGKMFASGMAAKGARLILGSLEGTDQAFIAEGLATGWSVYAATGKPVVVAFSAGQITAIAGDLVKAYRGCQWVVAADAGDTGIDAAKRAADLHGCLFAAPESGDWNDQALDGVDIAREISEQVEGQKAPDLDAFRVDVLSNPRPPDFVVRDYLPRRHVTLLTGHGGSGKSTLALQIAAALVHGKTGFLGVARRGRALFLSAEDEGATLIWRLKKVCEHMEIDRKRMADDLLLMDVTSDGILFQEARDPELHIQVGRVAPLYERLDKYLERQREQGKPVDLVVVDNASDCFSANENDRRLVRGFIQELRRLAAKHNLSILLLGHINKANATAGKARESYSGSTGWHNSVRSRLALTVSESDPDTAKLEQEKNQFGPLADAVTLTQDDGIWIHGGEPTKRQAESQALIQKAEQSQRERDEAAVLAAMRERIELGDTINPAPQTPTSAWRTLTSNGALPEGFQEKKADQQRFNATLTRLEKKGIIVREEYRHHYKTCRRWRIVDAGLSESASIRHYPPVSASE